MAGRPDHDAVGWPFDPDGGPGDALTAFLDSLPVRPRLLGLGEPTHGLEELPRLRNRAFEHLVDHEGYRSIALESDCLAGLAVDDFVAGGQASLDEAMRVGFSHGFGESQANRGLVAWLAEQNRQRDADDRLRFYGFDAPMEMAGANSPRSALCALHDYLAAHLDATMLPHSRATILSLLGDDERWSNPAAAMDPTQSIGVSDNVTTLRLIADDLGALLLSESPRLIGATSQDDWWRTALRARTAAGLLRYHAAMADTSATRVARLMGLRDAMMADNLLAIAAREDRRGHTLVFAHNRHLQKHPSFGQLADIPLTWWSAGAIASAHLGADYALLAMAFGAAPDRGLDAPGPDTPEGVLAGLSASGYIFRAARLAEALGDEKPRTDHSPEQGYFPLEPDRLDGLDGVLFLREV